MKGQYKRKWKKVVDNDIGRLYQGIRYIESTYTGFFIHRYEVTQDSKVDYSCIVCGIIPQKKEIQRVRLTVGGKELTYDGPVFNLKADLIMAKLHWSSALSTPYRK